MFLHCSLVSAVYSTSDSFRYPSKKQKGEKSLLETVFIPQSIFALKGSILLTYESTLDPFSCRLVLSVHSMLNTKVKYTILETHSGS